MENIWKNLRDFAKSNKAQNLFVATKEISSIHLFKNSIDFSKLQEIFLNYLYIYDGIMKDIITERISKHVLDDEIYEDAYTLWKREKKYQEKEPQDNKKREVHLVAGKDIKFPTKEVK
jgi:hypothetical protein